MRYVDFEFENFKGIEQMTLSLTRPVTTLIGLNESGKTTILEAIFCFSYGAEDLDVINPGMASLRDPESWIPISRRANFNDAIVIRASVELDEVDQRAFKEHMRKQFGLRLDSTPSELKITETYRFANSRYQETKRTWTLILRGTTGQQRNARLYGGTSPEWQGAVAYLTAHLPHIWYFPNFLFELPERFLLEQPGSAVLEEDRDRNDFYRTTFEQILTSLGNDANLQTHVVERSASGDKADEKSLSAVLLEMSRKVTTTIIGGWGRIFSRGAATQEVEIKARTDDTDGTYLELRIKGPDGYYDLAERSLGFRWFFMFLLMTSFNGETDPQRKPLFLLDEPASNLHSTAQAELLESFETLTNRCDLVYTTHSHHLINLRWLDAAYVVINSALTDLTFADYMAQPVASKTEISATPYRRFANEHPDNTSYYQPVLDLLEYRPSTLEPVPGVVMVEGKSDTYHLRFLAGVAGVSDEIRMVPGNGAGSLDAVIRLYLGWGTSFLVLLDGDAEGRKQKARYEEQFGPLLGSRCVLLTELCESEAIKEIEDLMSDGDKLRIFAALGEVPARKTKKALLRSVMELYATGQSVELDDKTIESVRAVLTKLRSQLDDQV